MKTVYSFLIVCLVSLSIVSAQTDSIQQQKIQKEIQEYLSEKNYTRIPNTDFDKILQNEIDTKVKSGLTYWMTLISVIIAVSGGVAAFAFNLKIKQVVHNEIESKNAELLESLDKMMIESKMNKLRMDFEVLKEDHKLNPNQPTLKSDTYLLLEECVHIKFDSLIPEVVDFLGCIIFSERHIDELDLLIRTYERNYNLKATTCMNAAILSVEYYNMEGTKRYKDNCIKYCHNSIDKMSWYGEPRGILILLHAMDFVKAESQQMKETALKEVQKVLANILKGSSNYIATNTCDRLDRDKNHDAFKEYLQVIQNELPDEFNKLYAKAIIENQ
ncbi:hypothetical protein [Pseudotenacibaculum haliotis]|uniref:Uncharacterized protein n=1 Tax=Pseudotenacibaculum haliotis TaxID=1862138 RepID=A0ABW5LUU1_9FLAO